MRLRMMAEIAVEIIAQKCMGYILVPSKPRKV